jgi:hypothetical protein
MACQEKKWNNNVVLTDFTKELISVYINDVGNLNAKNRKDEIIITSTTDTSYYYLSVFANNSKEYKFCREDFVGQTSHLGHLIKVFGDENSIFYFIKHKIKGQMKCKEIVTEYDPNEWFICFNKDKSFCKMKTHKVTANGDLSAIQSLAEKNFRVSDTTIKRNDNEVYQSHEVENSPKFLWGEDTLRHIISTNFKIHKQGNFGKIPIVIGLIVDKKGHATLNGIIKSSNDIELDNEAVRVAEIICQYEFTPALHRGQNINSTYSVVFLKSDIAH